MPRRRAIRYLVGPPAVASIFLIYFLLTWQQFQLLQMITEDAEKGGPGSPELLVAFSNQDKIKGRTNNVKVPTQRLQQDQQQQRSLEPSFEQVQTDDVNKKALQWLQNENNHVLNKGSIKSPPKFKPPPGYWEHPHQDFHSNNSTPLDAQKLLRQRHSKLRHPILSKKLITVIGLESSGSTFLTKTLAAAVGADPTRVDKTARTKDGKTGIQHLSLPWGWFCENNSSDEISVQVVDAMVPSECFRYEFAPSLDPSIAQEIMSQKQVKVARDGPQTEVEAQVLQQCREEVFTSEYSNSSCGAKCGTGVFNGYALYPKRFSVNITSQIEWYLQRGVDVTVIISTRDRSISVRGKDKNHCNIEYIRRREDEVAIDLLNEALEKYGAFGSIKRGLVIVSSYEALMSMKEEYLFGLYKQLGINSTYVPSFSDGNEKYVTDANEANMDEKSSTAKHDVSVHQPKSEAKDVNPKDLILPKTLITVVGLEGSGSTFLSTALSKVMPTDSKSRLQHISLPQGCDSELDATTVDALVPELASYPGRFYVNITSHIEWYLSRGVDMKVVLVLRDKTISKKAKLRNHHCRIPPEAADVEDDAAMKIMREAYQKYGEERVMIVSYEGLMQFKQSYLFEIYKSLGIESTYAPDFIDGNRKYVAKDIQHQMHGPALHKKGKDT